MLVTKDPYLTVIISPLRQIVTGSPAPKFLFPILDPLPATVLSRRDDRTMIHRPGLKL